MIIHKHRFVGQEMLSQIYRRFMFKTIILTTMHHFELLKRAQDHRRYLMEASNDISTYIQRQGEGE